MPAVGAAATRLDDGFATGNAPDDHIPERTYEGAEHARQDQLEG